MNMKNYYNYFCILKCEVCREVCVTRAKSHDCKKVLVLHNHWSSHSLSAKTDQTSKLIFYLHCYNESWCMILWLNIKQNPFNRRHHRGRQRIRKRVSKFRISAGVSLNERENNERVIMKNRWTSGGNIELSCLNALYTNYLFPFSILLIVRA